MMSDISFTEFSALAKATVFPVLYFVFFAWSVTLLAS
jgi:hypothetical protein